jgi:hypothetical protein|tara:strand:+ start:369 stop:1601 length:1233 start_codon:yes stop_codon:yes gene_type:complete
MTVKKGLRSLVNSTPDFSNQNIQNAVNQLKIGWVAKTSTLDIAIKTNNVLTDTQKNNARLTINNHPHLNIGRYLNDLLDHTDTILDGTVVFLDNPDTEDTADFLEILQTIQSIQTLIPNLYGVSAGELNRDVNDHLGTINNKLLETEDSSQPVLTSLLESIRFIHDKAIGTDTLYQTALTNMTNFVDSVVADSTDFQQTLNTFATAVATAATNFNTALAVEPYLTKRVILIANKESINVQVALEKSNLSGIRNYVIGLTNHISYTSLAEDDQLRTLMTRISQNSNWANYFNEYEKNSANINPIYTTGTDLDKTTLIDTILRDSGLPDVLDFVDIEAVANKAKKDARIDTAGYDRYTTEQQISDACKQLNIKTVNRSIYNQSESLLDSLNRRDRDLVATALDLNQTADTLS